MAGAHLIWFSLQGRSNMLAARLAVPIVATALSLGSVVAADTALAQVGQSPAAVGKHPGAAGPSLQALLRAGAADSAPLVTDLVPADASKRGLPAPPVSPQMALAGRIRQSQARIDVHGVLVPAAIDLAATQQPQIRNYYCGPATVSEMLAQMGVKLSQRAAARELHTTLDGTDWSDGTGYPVPNVLNANQKRHAYVVVALPWSPTARQVKTYQNNLVTDVGHDKVPIAGNAYEVPGGPHLVGHPLGETIMHWFDIRGYSAGGAITDYEDSVHGAPAIGWAGSVPAYSALTSATIVYIVGARGYVW
jgi:hypothetical protein